jgi:hypothetical protein
MRGKTKDEGKQKAEKASNVSSSLMTETASRRWEPEVFSCDIRLVRRSLVEGNGGKGHGRLKGVISERNKRVTRSSWSDGVVGYHVRFTSSIRVRERSPVRARVGSAFCFPFPPAFLTSSTSLASPPRRFPFLSVAASGYP